MDAGPFEQALAEAWGTFRSGDCERGLTAVKQACIERPRHGEAWYLRGLLLERQGRLGAADRCFHRAAIAGEEPQAPPFRIPWRRFVAVVEEVAAGLPEALRDALGECSVEVHDYPTPEVLEDLDADEPLGLFIGSPRGERIDAEASAQITPRILLFRRAHEHACSSAAELVGQVRVTLIHELGHYLGHDEDQVEELGWG